MKFSTNFDSLAVKIGVGLFLVSLLIRLIGIDWGLPNEKRYHSLHPDEEIVWMYSQQIEPAKLDFMPGFYNYGTFFLTITKITSDVVTAYTGGVKEDGSNASEVLGRVIKGGRIVSAMAGSALAWVVFLILYKRTHIVGAIAAGASIALAPGLVVHSRFMTVDVFATFLMALSVLWSCKLIKEADGHSSLVKAAIWAGVFAGLSAGTKYTGILVILVPTMILVHRWWADRQTQIVPTLLASYAAMGLSFFLSTPGMLLESGQFWKDFTYELSHTATGHGIVFAGLPTGLFSQIPNLFLGFGILTGMIGLVSLIYFAYQAIKTKGHLMGFWIGCLLLTFVMLFLIGRAEVKFLRYTFPLMIFLAVAFGMMVGESHSSKSKWGRAVVAFSIIALGGVGGGMVYVLTVTNWMSGMDPQQQMANVIRESEIESVGLVSDPWYYTPTLYPEANSGPYRGKKYRFESMMNVMNPRVLRYFPENPDERVDWDIRLLEELKPEGVVFSSFELEGYNRLAAAKEVPEEFKDSVERFKSFVKLLEQDYEIRTIVGGGAASGVQGTVGMHPYQTVHDMMYIRPILYLWIRKQDSETKSSSTSTP